MAVAALTTRNSDSVIVLTMPTKGLVSTANTMTSQIAWVTFGPAPTRSKVDIVQSNKPSRATNNHDAPAAAINATGRISGCCAVAASRSVWASSGKPGTALGKKVETRKI